MREYMHVEKIYLDEHKFHLSMTIGGALLIGNAMLWIAFEQ